MFIRRAHLLARLAAAALLLLVPGMAGTRVLLAAGAENPSLSPAPRVLLIGIDGADLSIIDRLIAAGKLPAFARLEREGAFGPLKSQEPLISPVVWTTIATGRAPQDHGVLDFVEVGADGQATPITSLRRRVPALWNIAGEFGKTSGFVGWYATFPAESVSGFQVSDRLAFHQVKSARATTGATFPEDLAARLRGEFGEPAADVAAVRARFLVDPAVKSTPDAERRLEELAKTYATSEFYRKILPVLSARYRPDLLAVYFEGLDACGHLFMEDAAPKRPEVSQADFDSLREAVDRYYEYQDEVLADLLRIAGPRTITVVVSDHGFKSGAVRPKISGRADTGRAPLWHRLHGVVFVRGDGVRAGARIEHAGIYDVVPTVLTALGVPLSLELTGHVLSDAFRPGALGAAPPPVPKYAALPPRKIPPPPADSEAVARLAALGYLGGAGRVIPHDAEGRTTSSWLNEGTARGRAGDGDGALRAFGRATDLDPKNVDALATAASIYIRRGDFGKAEELLDRAVRVDAAGFWVRAQRAALRLQTGRFADADRELDVAERTDDRLPVLHVLRSRVARARNDRDRAITELKTAEGLSDSEEMLLEILLLRSQVRSERGEFSEAAADLESAGRFASSRELAEARGDLAYARHDGAAATREYREAIAANPDSSALQRKLGETLGAMKDWQGSEAAFRRAIAAAKTPFDKEAAYGDLSVLDQNQGKDEAAAAVLRQATVEMPDSATLWALLGAAAGRMNRFPDSIAAYERSVGISPTALTCKTLAALVFEYRKDRPRAVALWKQSLALDPDQPDVRRFLDKYATK